MNREETMIEAQFKMIEITGKLSGYVKDIISSEEKMEMIEKINQIDENLKKLMKEVYKMSDALNLDFQQIIGGPYDD